MEYTVIWSPNARKSYRDILEYLNLRWGHASMKDFDDKLKDILNTIKQFPELYQYSPKNDAHRCVMTKQTSLFYRVQPETEKVELLLFWDNRRNPDDLNL